MHLGMILFGILMIVIGCWGLFTVIKPKLAIRLGNAFLFRERPEPRDWYVTYTRIGGVIGAVIAFGLAFLFLVGIPMQLSGLKQDKIDEEDRKRAVVARCESLLPLLTEAIVKNEDGSIANVAELSELAEANDARIEWREPVATLPMLGMVYETSLPPETLMFGISEVSDTFGSSRDECRSLELKL